MSWLESFLWLLPGVFGGIAGTCVFFLMHFRPKWEHEAAKKAVREYKYRRDQRELHDSGRLHPARDDAGPPARLYRARTRARRSTP